MLFEISLQVVEFVGLWWASMSWLPWFAVRLRRPWSDPARRPACVGAVVLVCVVVIGRLFLFLGVRMRTSAVCGSLVFVREHDRYYCLAVIARSADGFERDEFPSVRCVLDEYLERHTIAPGAINNCPARHQQDVPQSAVL